MKIGIGYDVHKFGENRKLIIGGVDIPYEKGLIGHSDADVLVHAIIDSILGAINCKDIGSLFPDNNVQYKNISSLLLLEKVEVILKNKGYKIGNIDNVIICQEPKMNIYIDEMKKNISKVLKTDIENISIKATTTERLGFEGRKEGISVQSVCLVCKI